MAVQKSGNINSPAKSDSLPVIKLGENVLRIWSFRRSRIKAAMNPGEINIVIRVFLIGVCHAGI
jgi:hypothetical protein